MLDVTISGVVFELTPSGRAPIEGATLHCGACGVETHAWAYTNSQGRYEFIGVWLDGSPATSISIEQRRVWRPSRTSNTTAAAPIWSWLASRDDRRRHPIRH